ncbi:glycosyltransferase, partial [Thermococci archaeon]
MLMKKYEEKWRSVRKIDEVPLWGNAVGGEPEPVKVTLELLKIRA